MKPRFFTRTDKLYEEAIKAHGDADMWPPEIRAAVQKASQAIVDEEMWSPSDVTFRFGISKQMQSNLSAQIPGRIKIGSSVVYLTELAYPWFENYVATRARDR